jgi:hypothetical protein
MRGLLRTVSARVANRLRTGCGGDGGWQTGSSSLAQTHSRLECITQTGIKGVYT